MRFDPLEVRRYISRFLVLTDVEYDAMTLWVTHTYVARTARATPYLHFRSPEPGSGKTTALEVLETIVHEGIGADDLSGAALFRLVSERRPTLLYDEVDGVFAKKNSDSGEDIRKILCSGYRQGKVVWRVGGPQRNELQEFDPFCPKALAGLGALPGTLAHRAIAIEMQPPRPDDEYEEFDLDDVEYDAAAIRERLGEWAYGAEPALRDPARRPAKLADLDARANEIWRVLFRIADLFENDWPRRARVAALDLSGRSARADAASTKLRLLASIRDVFPEERIVCQELADALNALEEEAWGGWNDGSGITTREIEKQLSHFHVRAGNLRIDGRVLRGYKREQFEDVWARYLPVSEPSNHYTATTGIGSGFQSDSKPLQDADVAVSDNSANQHEQSGVAVVAVSSHVYENGVHLTAPESEAENERAVVEEVAALVDEGVLIPLDIGTATFAELREHFGA
jgi:Protein of unknown function (DUF3631)